MIPRRFEDQFPQQAALLQCLYAVGGVVVMHVTSSGFVRFYGIRRRMSL